MNDRSQKPTEIDPQLISMSENNGTVQPAGPDPFDPEALRLNPQDMGANLGIKKVLLEVPCRKPSKEWFIRVHSDANYHLTTAVIELKESRETYLVAPALWPELAGETTFSPRGLYTAINRQGDVFLWPIRLPGADGRVDSWSRSALNAADTAREKWLRVQPNMRIGAYEIITADHIDAPVWPDIPFTELLRLAFRDQYIDSLEHPVIRQLYGRV